jgi:hypothetical protein
MNATSVSFFFASQVTLYDNYTIKYTAKCTSVRAINYVHQFKYIQSIVCTQGYLWTAAAAIP